MIISSSIDFKIPKTNCHFPPGLPVSIRDIQSFSGEQDMKFDLSGFAYLFDTPSAIPLTLEIFRPNRNCMVDELLAYLEETSRFVEEYFGAKQVLRKSDRGNPGASVEDVSLERTSVIPPAYKAHADLAPAGGLSTLKAYLNNQELEYFYKSKSQARIVNFWRPLVSVVEDVPLAMCDRSTVRSEDWLPYDRIDDTGPGEGVGILTRQISKVSLIQKSWTEIYAESFTLGHTAHAAFVNTTAPDCCVTRASIEVRLIVITDQVQN
ncbi:hypothetical protein DL98DRAFT_535435 [Cadophora sp. DSE1049]|nr:hypothetical protein DL98DRAFT_535435 [Cadophora sp. DSE1049]